MSFCAVYKLSIRQLRISESVRVAIGLHLRAVDVSSILSIHYRRLDVSLLYSSTTQPRWISVHACRLQRIVEEHPMLNHDHARQAHCSWSLARLCMCSNVGRSSCGCSSTRLCHERHSSSPAGVSQNAMLEWKIDRRRTLRVARGRQFFVGLTTSSSTGDTEPRRHCIRFVGARLGEDRSARKYVVGRPTLIDHSLIGFKILEQITSTENIEDIARYRWRTQSAPACYCGWNAQHLDRRMTTEGPKAVHSFSELRQQRHTPR